MDRRQQKQGKTNNKKLPPKIEQQLKTLTIAQLIYIKKHLK